VVSVSVADGAGEVEHFWEVSDMGAPPVEGEVCSSGDANRVSVLDGQQEKHCKDQPHPVGAEDGMWGING